MSDETDQKTSAVKLDKELCRQAYANYREWIETDLRDKALPASWRTLAEQWQQYLEIAELLWDSRSTPEDLQQLEKILDIDREYACMFKFEAWRFRKTDLAELSRGSTTDRPITG